MNNTTLHSYDYLARFACLGERCEDTCCKGWGMQVDPVRFALYEKQAPDLLNAVVSGETEHVMKRDPKTDHCVKFENGLCNIHKTRGTNFLGDACHFYPRVTRKYGDVYTQAAALSCPEITRLALFGETPFAPAPISTDRLPVESKEYLPSDLTSADAVAVTRVFLDACEDKDVTAERVLMRIISAAHSLHYITIKDWPGASGFMLRTSESRFPEAEIDFSDGYHLIQILEALIGASKPTARPRLDITRQSILKALNIQIAANTYEIISSDENFDRYKKLWDKWQKNRAKMQPILKRWIQAEMAMSGFPFSGFGRNLAERATVMAVRFATLRLAFMSALNLDEPEVIRIVQSLSRFLDHLADPELSMLAYKEVGWDSLPRIRGLLMDI